jgi:hypothetical protein
MTPAEIERVFDWYSACRPTPKCNFSMGNPPLEYVPSRSYKDKPFSLFRQERLINVKKKSDEAIEDEQF